jgi:hypothetical protein
VKRQVKKFLAENSNFFSIAIIKQKSLLFHMNLAGNLIHQSENLNTKANCLPYNSSHEDVEPFVAGKKIQ